jgi:MFS-type transporter involved in bile tolerance (Atg22 family)
VIGLGNGLGSGTMMTLGADLAPADSRGEFLGVWRLIGDGGSAGGPVVVGAVADVLGLSLATFTIAGVGLLAAAMLGTLVPETLQRKKV